MLNPEDFVLMNGVTIGNVLQILTRPLTVLHAAKTDQRAEINFIKSM